MEKEIIKKHYGLGINPKANVKNVKNIVQQSKGFYERGKARSRKGYLESPETRRCAGISIRED